MSNRVLWIDLIKVFAIFSIVLLHSAAPILDKIGEIDSFYWMIGNVYDSMVRMAVPLFFMVSGFLLLNHKEEPLAIFFKKRFLKVVIPLMVWSFIYILFMKYELHKEINIYQMMKYSLYEKVYYHLWFLYTILGIYLVLPILKVFIKNSSQNLQIYFIILWAISVSIIPFINHFTGLGIKNYMPMMAGYIGYLVLGYQLAKIQITKRLLYISIFFIIIATIGTILGTHYSSVKATRFIDFFYGYFSLFTLIQAIAYFIVLKYIGENILYKSINISRGITVMSITSLGIYLIHPIYIHILDKIGINIYASNPLLMIPIIAIFTFILSLITILFIQKIPIGRLITP